VPSVVAVSGCQVPFGQQLAGDGRTLLHEDSEQQTIQTMWDGTR
jgi:hypothetical protein